MSIDPSRTLRERYVKTLVATGHLHSERWIEAFRQVPRHLFVPRVFRPHPSGGYEAMASGNPDWLEMVYSDRVLNTQLDGDDNRWAEALSAPVAGAPTSSSSQPSLMAQMLEALDLRAGHRVLEIGTGTGYQAALLSHRLGSTQVATVDVDRYLCDQAEAALRRCGYSPVVACHDGIDGYATRAPYDRIIATCSVPSVPAAWVGQTRPGGLILTSIYRPLGGGPLVQLTAAGDGTAQGRFLSGGGGFMPTRDELTPEALPLLKVAQETEPDHEHRPTTVTAEVLAHPDFGMLAALHLPGVTSIGFTPDNGDGSQTWLLGEAGSWACLNENAATVAQRGPRHLWNELEELHEQWTHAGSPSRERYGLTVASDRQQLWLDHPDQEVPGGRFADPGS